MSEILKELGIVSFAKESTFGVAPTVAAGQFIDAVQDSISLKETNTQLTRNMSTSGLDASRTITGAANPDGAFNFELKKNGSDVIGNDLLEVAFGEDSKVSITDITATGGSISTVEFAVGDNSNKIKAGYPIYIQNVSLSNEVTAHYVVSNTAGVITFTPALSEAVAASDLILAVDYFEVTEDLSGSGTMKMYENGGNGRLLTGTGMAPASLAINWNVDELVMVDVSGLLGQSFDKVLNASVPAGDKTIINGLDFDNVDGHPVLAGDSYRIVNDVASAIDVSGFVVTLANTNAMKRTSRSVNAVSANIGTARAVSATLSEFKDDANTTVRDLARAATPYNIFQSLDDVAIALNGVQTASVEAGDAEGLGTYDQTLSTFADDKPVLVIALK